MQCDCNTVRPGSEFGAQVFQHLVSACGGSALEPRYPMGYLERVHTVRHKRRLVARVRRLKGQIEAVERALLEERGCEAVVHTIAAARGAMNALAAEVLCEHIEEHLGSPRIPGAERTRAAKELARVIRQFVG
jgi:FrmR/RcnR family transcriptional regulator, repressor of frmRAB operon